MKIRLPGCYPVTVGGTTGHWKPKGTNHGPQSNPPILALRLVKLRGTAAGRGTPGPDSGGRRLWAYFRGGYAWHFDIHVNRSDVCPCCKREYTYPMR